MAIHYDSSKQIFHLQAKDTSYVFQITKWGYPAHLYWGKKIRTTALEHVLKLQARASFSPTPDLEDQRFSLDTLPQEYPVYGAGDFRNPAFHAQLENGSTVTELKYESHQMMKGKPNLDGLPAVYVENDNEAETLELVLADDLTGLKVILSYTVFENFDAVARSVRYVNEGEQNLNLLRTLSMSIDFHHANFDMLHLSGAWVRERFVEKRALTPGGHSVESRRGASSHQHNPFIALMAKQADEDFGEVYGFSLVYSGSFLAHAEVDQFSTTRVSIGINPFDFSWLLEPGSSFQAPEAVMVYSAEGLGGMSRTYHRLYRTRLCRGEYRDKERPILVNNWEATYFNFNADKIESIAKAGSELGIELFVLDDGWFGKRDNDTSSLGDWFVDKHKLPNGLCDLAERVNRLDMKFGLWFEPEMISPDSELYRQHPDWCLHVPNRRRTQARNQLILDYSRSEVCDYIIRVISDVLSSAPISYVKWDMNRNMTEIGSASLPPERQRETAHRYMLGLYRVLEEITSKFPNILFESCSGGGGRFDPGMLYYMPQTWTSDDTDAIMRLKIQYGTSIVYPASAIGAHISAVPNHQAHRITPLETRGHVAMSGNFGYELDLTKFSDEEKEAVTRQVEQYKGIRHVVQFGDFYRLLSPFAGNDTSWMFVSADKTEAVVFFIQTLAEPNGPLKRLRFKGLDPETNYYIQELDGVYGGDHLMHLGINVPYMKGDFRSVMYRLRAAK